MDTLHIYHHLKLNHLDYLNRVSEEQSCVLQLKQLTQKVKYSEVKRIC